MDDLADIMIAEVPEGVPSGVPSNAAEAGVITAVVLAVFKEKACLEEVVLLSGVRGVEISANDNKLTGTGAVATAENAADNGV